MARSYYNLPSLTTLAAFETAARKLSFKKAAQELNVTPGAVSHQIKALEAEVGGRLFERKHHGVELTQTGEELHAVLHLTFSEISRVLVRIRKPQDDMSVSISSTTAVSTVANAANGTLLERTAANTGQSIRIGQRFHGPPTG